MRDPAPAIQRGSATVLVELELQAAALEHRRPVTALRIGGGRHPDDASRDAAHLMRVTAAFRWRIALWEWFRDLLTYRRAAALTSRRFEL